MTVSMPIWEGFDCPIQDPLEYVTGPQRGDSGREFDDLYGFGYGYQHLSTIEDYNDGHFRPYWSTWVQHSAHRAQARAICYAVTTASTIMESLENYVIGKGFVYKAASRHQGHNQALLQRVSDDLDRFLEINEWSGVTENHIHNRSRRDGEDFIAIFLHPTKGPVTRLINAEHITEPLGIERALEERIGCARMASSWTYGVHTREDDLQEHLGYFVQWDSTGTDYQYFPSNDPIKALKLQSGLMHQIRRNVDPKVKRGLSDFFPVAKQVLEDAKLLRNMVAGAAAQAAIAWVEQFTDKVSERQARKRVKANSDRRRRRTSSNGGDGYEYQRRMNPATALAMGSGKEFKPGPMSGGRENGFMLVSALSTRRIGARWSMPEFMISGDASNNNFASAVISEGPFTKARESDQRFYERSYREVLWKAFSLLCATGRYAEFGVRTSDQLRTLIDFEIEVPEVTTANKLEDAQAREIMNRAGVLSAETWGDQVDLDSNVEIPKSQAEKQKGVGLAESGASKKRQQVLFDLSDDQKDEIAERVRQKIFGDWNRQGSTA